MYVKRDEVKPDSYVLKLPDSLWMIAEQTFCTSLIYAFMLSPTDVDCSDAVRRRFYDLSGRSPVGSSVAMRPWAFLIADWAAVLSRTGGVS